MILTSNTDGTGSQVVLHTAATAYGTLFRAKVDTVIWPNIGTGEFTRAEVDGVVNGLKSTTDITAGKNDALNLTIDGVSQNITLAAGTYTQSQLVDELNTKLNPLQVSAALGYNYINLTNDLPGSGHSLAIDGASTSFVDLFCRIDKTAPVIVDGVTTKTWAEGSTTPTTTDTKATVTGNRDLSGGLTISAANDTLTFPAGHYDKDQFLTEVNNQLTTAGSSVIASYFEGKLKLSFDAVGYNTIDNIRGNGRGIIFNVEGRDGLPENLYQVGANRSETLSIDKPVVSVGLLHIGTIRIDDRTGAEKSLHRVDKAISLVSGKRGYLGAFENRLEHILANNENYHENLQSAESGISDLDMAKGMMAYIREKILADASLSIRAQAKVNSEKVLDLLK